MALFPSTYANRMYDQAFPWSDAKKHRQKEVKQSLTNATDETTVAK